MITMDEYAEALHILGREYAEIAKQYEGQCRFKKHLSMIMNLSVGPGCMYCTYNTGDPVCPYVLKRHELQRRRNNGRERIRKSQEDHRHNGTSDKSQDREPDF